MSEQPDNDTQHDKVSLSGEDENKAVRKVRTSRLTPPADMDESPDANQAQDDSSADDSDSSDDTPADATSDDTSDARSSNAAPKVKRRNSALDLELVRETAILSKDNPLLKRALNQQGGQDKDDDSAGERIPDAQREIILLIRGMVERVVISAGKTFKLGRFELGSSRPEEIDLTPYGALDRGVSRLHAQLHLEDQQLYITDLESTNGTYLGGEKLPPHDPTPLKKGDELLLGRLAVQILFR
jgi:hypothetical protein